MHNRPVNSAFDITPDNDADLAQIARGLYVGVAGAVKVDMEDGTTVTMSNLVAGVWHPVVVRKVYATGTAATGIIGGGTGKVPS